ncbi:hypothetical protein [Bifidobacterium sp.]|uniref:hypothetical protein n=1 Tax=Bifidobacterium sp. TaxID=41200 RepID=UPI0025C284B7|nr:hypothetical protein [Bifidobacterium sp.]MCH4209381.1 hypothetical protein [Bifidobacterium sp.]MCI1225143.1 hypothetical protein [Bifidobacterium sp.]
MHDDMNKWIKIIGNALTVVAIGFVVWKLTTQHIDYSMLLRADAILPIIVVTVLQTVIVLTNGFPWTVVVSSISNVKVSFFQTMPVYLKSNLMKYIPGNVFQYVGRNELAARYRLSHIQVAFATVTDVLLNVFSALCISLAFFRAYVVTTLSRSRFFWVALAMAALILICAGAALYMRREWAKSKIVQYSYLFTRRTVGKICLCLGYYIVALVAGGVLFALTFYWLLGEPFSPGPAFTLISAYTLSWLIGFITPGAPAGIGIKEAVMIAVVPASVSSPAIAVAMVAIRVIATIADILAFFISIAYERLSPAEHRKIA